jgi:serine/threonine protein kinase
VIKAFDIFFENNRAYMAMEYCPCDLFHLLSDKMKVQPSQAEIDCYFVQLLDGIRYLHQSGIAHLDLKLENCVISAEGILKIIDFGCAEVVRAPWETQRRPSHNIKGSRPYIAPEVFLNSSYDGQCADAWAVGIMYIAMTERRYPWSVANARLDTTFRDYAAVRHIADKAAPAAAPRAQRTVRFVVSSGTLHTTSFTSIDATSHRSAPTISSPTLLSTPEHATHKPSASEPILPRRTASYMSRLLPTRPEAWSLIAGLLCPDADRRMTIDQAWQDTWVRCVDRCHQGRPSSHHQHHSGGKSKHVID